jgi:hypothetical protein
MFRVQNASVVGLRQRDLAYGGCRLLLLEAQRALGQLQRAAAERDGAGVRR